EGVPAHLSMGAIATSGPLDLPMPPGVFVSGTCMNAGKTLAAARYLRALCKYGKTVAVAKLTGVAASKDTLSMLDCGATQALTFVDAGIPSTSSKTALAGARAVLSALASGSGGSRPDVIVAELGDGLLGEYGVLSILGAEDIKQLPAVH